MQTGGRPSPFTDRERLVGDAYADSGKLTSRQDIYRFRRSGPGFHDRLIAALDWSGAHTVLDVGCGNAVYVDRVATRLPSDARVVGLDLSPGMLASAPHPTGRVVGDVQALPIASSQVDAVLALHMLYHVPDPRRAARELRRVLRPGGFAVVSVNGPGHLAELLDLSDRRVVRGSTVLDVDAAADLLATAFDSVERLDFPDELVVTDPDPLLAYVRSTISLGEPETVAVMEPRIRAAVASGPLVITIEPGALVCR